MHSDTTHNYRRESGLAAWSVAWGVVTVTAWLEAWGERYTINPDGVSYLNLSDLYLAGHWAEAVNGYWSPGYPMLIALQRWLTRPSPSEELAHLHWLNSALLLVAFAAFQFFVYQLSRTSAEAPVRGLWAVRFVGPAEIAIATALFLWGTTVLNTLAVVTPDLMIAAVVFGVSGCLLLIGRSLKTRWCFLLGGLLGLGYLAKAVMFPLALVISAIASLGLRPFRLSFRRLGATIGVFLLLSAPQIIAVSLEAGRLTYGEVGQLAYAGQVNGYTRWWLGEPAGSGSPENPIRRIHRNPDVYEFSSERTSSSYPLWDDPASWLRGLRPHFSARDQFRAIRRNVSVYGDFMLLPALSLLLLFGLRVRDDTRRSTGPVIAASLSAFVLYALVHAEPRFFSGWAVVLFLSVLATFRVDIRRRPFVLGTTIVLAVIILYPFLGRSAWRVKQAAGAFTGYTFANPHWSVASGLLALGLEPYDRVGSIGRAFDGYWARLAKVQIAMEVNSDGARQYWNGSDSDRDSVHAVFRRANAKAIVFNQLPANARPHGLTELGEGHYVLLLTGSESSSRAGR